MQLLHQLTEVTPLNYETIPAFCSNLKSKRHLISKKNLHTSLHEAQFSRRMSLVLPVNTPSFQFLQLFARLPTLTHHTDLHLSHSQTTSNQERKAFAVLLQNRPLLRTDGDRDHQREEEEGER